MHTNGVNGTNGTPDPPVGWNCRLQGHRWRAAPPGSPTSQVCAECPAIGGPCPECATEGGWDGPAERLKCHRCEGTGHVELVEISLHQVADLRRDWCRFRWLVGEYARMTGSRKTDVIREIDELIGLVARDARPPSVPLDGRAHEKTPARRQPERGSGAHPRAT